MVNEKIGQIDNPFIGLKETFEEGIKGIQNAFTEQNAAIKEALESQKKALEVALESQQQAVVKKLQETPGQLQAISELSKVLDKLNKTMSGSTPAISGLKQGEGNQEVKAKPKGLKRITCFIKDNYMPICAGGSFVSLLILLALRLLGI